MKPSLLDRALMAVAPETALRRALARHRTTALYDAGKRPGSRPRPSSYGPQSQNISVAESGAIIREKARYLESNYELAEAILTSFQNFVIGEEVLFEPQIRTKSGDLHIEANEEVSYWMREWMKAPDVTGQYDYHEGARQHIRSRQRDGEMFQQYVEGYIPGLHHDTKIPLSIEHIQSEFLPFHYSDVTRGIRQSIQLNAWGRPIRYWLHKQDPTDSTMGMFKGSNAEPDKSIVAENMAHDKATTHFRQIRGVSIFANVLGRFDEVKGIEEAERTAARCAAAMVGWRMKGSPEDWEEEDPNAEPDPNDELSFEPGMWTDLRPGESAEVYSSNRPNNALIPFLEEQYKRIAGGTAASYSTITRDYSGTFSSQRQELVETHVGYGVIHADLCNAKFLPDYRRVLGVLIKYRLWVPPPDVDLRTLTDVDIPRPPMIWIDPKKEAEGYSILVENDLESRQWVQRARGRDPRTVAAQIQADPFRDRALSKKKPGTIGADEDDKDRNDPDED